MLKVFAGGRVFGQTHGSPPYRVMALHGWQRSSADWDQALSGLDAIAVDLPGFGASPAPQEAWPTRRYAEELVPLLEELAPRPVVVGHSFGGRVAVWLAADQPDMVGGLVLTGVPFARPPGQARPRPHPVFRAGRALHRLHLVSDARIERLRRRYGSRDYAQASGVMRQINVLAVTETDRAAYDEALAAIRCPVELVWGDDDTAAPLPVAEAAATRLADARLTVVPGAGHLTPTTAPDAIAQAIARLLA